MISNTTLQATYLSAKPVCQPVNQEDLDRVSQTRQGSLEAFNELVIAYQTQVYNLAYWMLGDEDAAEDAAQEAFCRAYLKISTFNGSSFRAWILGITTNYCLDQIRRSKRRPVIPLEPRDPDYEDWEESSVWLVDSNGSPEQLAERADRCALINRCLLALAPEDRAPIILVDVQEMTYLEAARTLGLPMGTFKSRLNRARAKLIAVFRRAPGAELLLS